MTNNGSRFETGERLIIGDQMRKARQMLAIAPSETAQHLGVSEAGLLAWEQERAAPTLTQLEALGGLYGRSLDYFLRHTPPAPDHIEFRSTSRLSFGSLSAQARLALARFDELCRAAFELEQLLGKHRPPPRPTPSELPAPQLARERRAALGLPDGPIRDLLDRLVGVGIRVFQLPVPGDAFSGFSYWHSDYGPCILLNWRDSPGRKNFTLAHEYAHLLCGHRALVCEIWEKGIGLRHSDERAANRFSCQFLMPESGLREDFARHCLSLTPTLPEIGKMAGRWCVSVQAMGYRLEDIGLLRHGHTDHLLASHVPPPRRVRRGRMPSYVRQRGQEFVSNALASYREGQISLGKLAECLGLPLRKAIELAQQANG